MLEIGTRASGHIERDWWEERTHLEKTGAAVLGAVRFVVLSAIPFPHAAAATAGGALTAGGGVLLKKAFGR